MALAVRAVELRLMGEPALLLGGEPASFAGFPRLPALLAFLALTDGPVRRDRLAFALWPDEMESAARANLRRALHRLQTLLGSDAGVLDVTTTTLALRRDRASCDLWDLERFLSRPSLSDEDIAGAMHAFGGGLLPALEDEWLTTHRTRLRERFTAAVGASIQRAVNENDAAAVLRRCRALLTLDPFSEETLRTLMQALAQSGDRSGALAEYRAFAQRLQDEFQVQPDPATVELYEALSKSTAPRRTHNLPFETNPFIGRESELEQIRQAFSAGRAVTVCGPPGVGKSRLALHYAHAQRGENQEAWYVQLAPARSRRDILDALLAVLRIPQMPQEEPVEALYRGLADRDVLILLDTAEHLVGDAGTIAAGLLANCERVRILTTSREALKIAAERVVRIEPLAMADAKRLLADRAVAAAGANIALDDSALSSLCRALEGLPLAIELAAARASAFSLSELARRAAGHQSLEETIGWSYALLAPFEQDCLRALAVFEDSWTLEAAAMVCAGEALEIENAVASLVDKSFAHALDLRSGRRYALYDSVRDFALRHSAMHERHVASAAFIMYYRQLVESLAPQLTRANQQHALDVLHDERNNIAAVLNRANESSATWGADFSLALYRYWLTRGSYGDALHWMERFSEVAQDASLRARCCADGAVLATLLGDMTRAERLLECAQNCGPLNDAAALEVHQAAGVMAHERGDLRAARAEFVASLECARRTKDDAALARALDNIGTEDTLLEDYPNARLALEESLTIYRRLGGVESVGWVLYHLAGLAFECGDYESAIELNAESFEIRQTLDHRYGIALCYQGMAKAKFELKRYDEAEADYIKALRLWKEAGQRSSIAIALESLAAIAVFRKEYERGGVLSQAADRIRDELEIAMRPYEQHLHAEYRAKAAFENVAAFDAGRERALALSENRCIELALSG